MRSNYVCNARIVSKTLLPVLLKILHYCSSCLFLHPPPTFRSFRPPFCNRSFSLLATCFFFFSFFSSFHPTILCDRFLGDGDVHEFSFGELTPPFVSTSVCKIAKIQHTCTCLFTELFEVATAFFTF